MTAIAPQRPPLALPLAAVLAGLACNAPGPSGADGTTTGTTGNDDTLGTTEGADSSGDTTAGAGLVELAGAVQKGPFILGTSISLSTLDATGNPSGATYSTQTINDRGEFDVSFDAVGATELEANGFYFNEATGTLSSAPLTLRAIYVVEQAGPQSATINMVTHLAFGRVKQLLAQGITYAEATAQAEHELAVALDVGFQGFEPGALGVELNLAGGDTDANAYLLAVSSVLAQAGVDAAGGIDGQVDARVQELANAISLDLADDGAISSARHDQLVAARHALDTGAIEAALAARFAEIGETAAVPDMDRVLDQDDDGLRNDQDNCPRDANAAQLDADDDGIGNECDPCPNAADNVGGLGCSCEVGSPICGEGSSCPAGTCVPTTIASITSGQDFTCARLDTGAVRCWGYSGFWGSLGYPNLDQVRAPAQIGDVDIGGEVVAIDAGAAHTCVSAYDGMRCWGGAFDGVLGYGNLENIGDDEPPSAVGPIELNGWAIGPIAAGTYGTCVVRGEVHEVIKCWGMGFGDDELPGGVLGVVLDTPIESLDLGNQHGCVVLEGGAVRCWGTNVDGELGYGNFAEHPFLDGPVGVGNVSLGQPALQVATGYGHSCALLQDGSVRCWGWGLLGQLGLGNTANIGDNEVPTAVPPVSLGEPATAVAVGDSHSCAILQSGAVRCWGEGDDGRLGLGNTDDIGDDELPTDVGVIDLGAAAVQITAGYSHTCALLDTGNVRCWGAAIVNGLDEPIGDDEVPADGADVEVI